MSISEPNYRSKSCPICSEVFNIKPTTRRRVINTKLRRHLKGIHNDYYRKVHRWDIILVFYVVWGGVAMGWLFFGVCDRYGNDCGPPIIREGVYSPLLPIAIGIYFLPIFAAIVRRSLLQEKFRRDWQPTHGQASMGTVPTTPV
ncbi:MAG TPA: hypothetical protein VNA15_10090 [Candidatus Angelobacter sp.]|nr:hypothetical protein [Candidatus Angelobacter sp.]